MCLVILGVFCSVVAYQPTEPGLFGVFMTPSEQHAASGSSVPYGVPAKPVCRYERGANEGNSDVMIVNGAASFAKHVVCASFERPVVVKVHSIHSKDSHALRPEFQQLALHYKNTISCVSVDLFQQCAGEQENYCLVVDLMNKLGITKIDLPLVMFFKNGTFYCPAHMPVPVLVGFCTGDFLVKQVEKKYFVDSFDMTKTSTSR